MITIQGKGVSKGIAKGPLYFFQRSDTTVTLKVVSDIEAEKARLAVAQEQSIRQLNALAEQCQEDAGEAMAVLFETHAMFVEDEDFVACITSLIDEESCNAEYAVEQAGIQFAAMFAAMDDAYMQARAADIKDVAKRILNNLLGVVDGGIDSEEPVILAADDLTPSDTCSWTSPRFWDLSPWVVPVTLILLFWPVLWVSLLSAVLVKLWQKATMAVLATLMVKLVS